MEKSQKQSQKPQKQKPQVNPDQFLKQIYSEIVRGTTKLLPRVFFKHPTQVEYFSVFDFYQRKLEELSSRGILTEKELLDRAIKNKWWTAAKEDEIAAIKSYLKSLEQTKKKAVFPSAREAIEAQIQTEMEKLGAIYIKRNPLVHGSAEQYANKNLLDFYLLNFLFQDAAATNLMFQSEEEFFELDEDYIEKLRGLIADTVNKFSDKHIKKIGAASFMQNNMILGGETVRDFFGKAVVEITNYQSDLFSYAKMFRNIIKNSENPIPDDVLSDPDKLIEWSESSHKLKKLMDKTPNKGKTRGERSGRATSFVGAKGSDYASAGMKPKGGLLQAARDAGGSLDIGGAIKKFNQ
jgi:hypothetical protein